MSSRTYDCEITAVSASQVEMRPDGPVQLYDNVMIDSGFDLYAKVVRIDDDLYTLAFTAKGAGFNEWLRGLYEKC